MLDWTSPRKYKNDWHFDFRLKKKLRTKPLNAAIKTVKYITKNYPAPYTLCLSGGVDSQAMLYAWKSSGVKFTTCSAIYNNWLNDYDLANLKQFARQEKVKINYINLDLINFLETEHDIYANRYHCGSPQITTFMKIADQIKDGTVIMSGNFKLYKSGIPDNNNFSLFKYGVMSGRHIIPWFFAETEDLFHSFQHYYKNKDEVVEEGGFDTDVFDAEPKDNFLLQYEQKVRVYQHFGFPVIPQKTKQNGFERIKQIYDLSTGRVQLSDKLSRIPGQLSNRTFDMLFRNKYEKLFAEYKYIVKRT